MGLALNIRDNGPDGRGLPPDECAVYLPQTQGKAIVLSLPILFMVGAVTMSRGPSSPHLSTPVSFFYTRKASGFSTPPGMPAHRAYHHCGPLVLRRCQPGRTSLGTRMNRVF